MLSMLIAYDASGQVIATLDFCVKRDENGKVIGLIDFDAHERVGGKLRDIWQVDNAVGSGTWPEWISSRAHEFRVERDGGLITALVHRTSGHRRERAAVMRELRARGQASPDGVIDARDLLGGPDRPLLLDDDGRTRQRVRRPPPNLPSLPMRRGNAMRPDFDG